MHAATIAAIATPPGSGGIGIIKISGKDALSIAGSIFRKPGEPAYGSHDSCNRPCFNSHHLYYGHIVCPEKGRIIDEVLLAAMLSPCSYTREDVVEIHSHSGFVVLSTILELVLQKGARLAEPGEFTKRAYINGRIDLTQAEAVIDIIHAKTHKALEIATNQITGGMRLRVESIRDTLMGILAEIEAAIEFPDDVGGNMDSAATLQILQRDVLDPLRDLLDTYKNIHMLRDGLKLIVVGRPNVGKSSLMNRLIQKDRVIVTPFPGTTRDLIEEALNIRGVPFIVADSAGLHESDDPIEVIGIQKTHEHIDRSDLILFIVDASCSLSREDFKIYEKIEHKRMILVINKSDLVEEGFNFDIPDSWNGIPSIKTSALYNWGLEELKDLIAKISIGGEDLNTRNAIIPNLRHKLALDRSLQAAVAGVEGIDGGLPAELIAIDFQEAIESLGEIIGTTAREDVLDQIFSRFCIGK
ncbi:MAG: tRNA uridine-5-carboxymethylaminomethyl(34) synthesis GTPase MnmE [Deltaproteobacteria bacterium]|nr:tRNA uridine-5-carboxymethylaminomethyl(34) synthesis GTPase MnmE [Deltaproteobacteria bacterium]MBW2199922.1 tRNA uridine-5-carboxymethylaminomethyl(34) synthesis GTPase MnmE [Deltaproteobacteria bacterium]